MLVVALSRCLVEYDEAFGDMQTGKAIAADGRICSGLVWKQAEALKYSVRFSLNEYTACGLPLEWTQDSGIARMFTYGLLR